MDTTDETRTDSAAAIAEPATRVAAVDGRHKRSERSREAIVEALLSLLREGTPRPSSTAVADRAGVTQRTVFNHFSDMDALLAAAVEHQSRRIRSLLPRVADGDLTQRCAAFTADLAVLLEDTMHMRWAIMVNDVQHAGGVDLIAAVHSALRRRLLATFHPELDRLAPATRDRALLALDLEMDAGVWRIRRFQHGQSAQDARAAIEQVLRATLTCTDTVGSV